MVGHLMLRSGGHSGLSSWSYGCQLLKRLGIPSWLVVLCEQRNGQGWNHCCFFCLANWSAHIWHWQCWLGCSVDGRRYWWLVWVSLFVRFGWTRAGECSLFCHGCFLLLNRFLLLFLSCAWIVLLLRNTLVLLDARLCFRGWIHLLNCRLWLCFLLHSSFSFLLVLLIPLLLLLLGPIYLAPFIIILLLYQHIIVTLFPYLYVKYIIYSM